MKTSYSKRGKRDSYGGTYYSGSRPNAILQFVARHAANRELPSYVPPPIADKHERKAARKNWKAASQPVKPAVLVNADGSGSIIDFGGEHLIIDNKTGDVHSTISTASFMLSPLTAESHKTSRSFGYSVSPDFNTVSLQGKFGTVTVTAKPESSFLSVTPAPGSRHGRSMTR
jgi:hypothetical protein